MVDLTRKKKKVPTSSTPPAPRTSKYCQIPLEYKYWVQELCQNYLNGYTGKVVKQGKTQRAITRTEKLLEALQ